MNDGVDGEGIPGAEPPVPEQPAPAAPTEWSGPESPAPPMSLTPEPPAAGQPVPEPPAEAPAAPVPAPPPPWAAQGVSTAPWAAPSGMPTQPPAPLAPAVPAGAYPSGYPHWAARTPAPEPLPALPPSAPQPAASPWARQDDPWAFTPPPPPPSYPGWTPAWPAGPAPAPRLQPSRRTAALAALLLFAAAAGASAGVVALATRSGSTSPTSSIQNGSPFDGNGRGIFGNPGVTPNDGGGSSGGSSNGASIDASSIESKLDPAIVDIVVSLAGGQGTAEGTGMVITSGGQVLTNNHVIDGADSIKVQVDGSGPSYSASVVGYDVADDVALLQIQNPPSNMTTIAIGDPNQLNVGDSVLALGNALGRGGTPQPAPGTVTALDQTITASDPSGQSETLSGLIETNANIQPGDSGGPLADSSGKVIGMDTAASVAGGRFRFGGVAGQGYAIPISNAMSIVQQIRNGGGPNINTGRRALLGVEIADSAQGATVQGVTAGGPAQQAGIGAGDVITSVGGVQVTSASSLQAAIIKHKPGDRVSVTWLDANGNQHSATVTLTTGPPA